MMRALFVCKYDTLTSGVVCLYKYGGLCRGLGPVMCETIPRHNYMFFVTLSAGPLTKGPIKSANILSRGIFYVIEIY